MSKKNLSATFDRLLSENSKDGWIGRMQQSLSYGSPLAALVVEKQLEVAKKMSLWQIFKMEMILTGQFLRHREFPEGVRARLVDKDNKPDWTFKDFKEVPRNTVANFFEHYYCLRFHPSEVGG